MRVFSTNYSRLRVFNNLLTVVVIALAVYIMVFPFLPHLKLWAAKQADSTQGYKYKSSLSDDAGLKDSSLPDAPDKNTLVIPSIGVDGRINESEDTSALSLGIWRRPHTSTPDLGGNTVLVAHRFSYSDPSVFYHLDKMAVGDKFVIFWDSSEYIYQVVDTSVVGPNQVSIEAPTQEAMVTLYTCTPIWTATNRLVVRADLISTDNEAYNKINSEESSESRRSSPLLNSGFFSQGSAL